MENQPVKFSEVVGSVVNLLASISVLLGAFGMFKQAEQAQAVATQVPELANQAAAAAHATVQVAGDAKEAVTQLVIQAQSTSEQLQVAISGIVAALTTPFTRLLKVVK